MDSLKDRFDSALKAVRKSGITAQRNVMGCCRSCISGEGKHDPDQPIIWHYGGQGNRFIIEGNRGYYYGERGAECHKVYFNHDNLHNEDGSVNEHGQRVLDIFAEYGLEIDQDFSRHRTLTVDLRKSVPHRTDEEQAWLINTLLDKYDLLEWHNNEWRAKGTFKDIWDKTYKTDDQWDAKLAEIRFEIDEAERIAKEREEHRIKLDKCKELKALILAEAEKTDLTPIEQTMLAKWLSLDIMNLTEFDATTQIGLAFKISSFREALVGVFDSADDFFNEHLEGFRELPDWAKNNLSTYDVWRDNFNGDYFYEEFRKSDYSWSEPKLFAVVRKPQAVAPTKELQVA